MSEVERSVWGGLQGSDGSCQPIYCVFSYDQTEPYAVGLTMHVPGDQGEAEIIPWLFARSLLIDGLVEPAGELDVRAWAFGYSYFIELENWTGHAVLQFQAWQVRRFLELTMQVCPINQESRLDGFDDEVAQLLG